MRRLPLLAALAILLLAPAGPARGEIYHWTDATGTPHFSDRPEDVPPEYRQQLPAELRGKAGAATQPAEPQAKPGLLSRALEAARPAPAPASPPKRSAPARPDFSKLAFLRHLGLGTLLAAVLGVLGLSFLFYAWLIQLACRICGEDVPAFSRALAVAGVQFVAGVGLGIIEFAILGAAGAGPSPLIRGINTLLSLAVNVSVLRAMLGQTLGKALVVQLVSMAITIAIAIAFALALLFGLGGMAALHAAG
jgi:hypothetical protein